MKAIRWGFNAKDNIDTGLGSRNFYLLTGGGKRQPGSPSIMTLAQPFRSDSNRGVEWCLDASLAVKQMENVSAYLG